MRVTAATADINLAAALRREGWRDCAASPVRQGDRTIGVLCSYNRGGLEGFEEGERAILEALAGEVAGAIEKSELVAAMVEERGKLSRIVESTSDGIVTLDRAGTITSWNRGFEEITGYSALAMIGSHRFGELRPRDVDGNDVMVERWAVDDVDPPSRLQIRAAGGTSRWLSCSYTRVAPDDESGVLIIVARDATRTHEVEQLKDDFISTVSHELRTPLTPIKGFAVTLLEAGDRLSADSRRDAVQSILRQAERLERLILNLLEVSRIEHHAVEFRSEPVDLAEVASRVTDDFRAAWPDRVFQLALDAGHCAVAANDVWIEQVLSNLVSNALKYAPEGHPITIQVTGVGDEVELAVVDHGPGIPEHEIDRVFERFERLAHRSTQAGTGLGLYIARQLAQAMGGSLTYRAGQAGGSCFALRLPAMGRLSAVS
ncbi:MAG: hypothetical protein QOG64_96, partial [Acidimicrobiaceae bacterium]|nr:hypothetical protein [Acidimicrobiaceae bacterium]